MFCQFVTFFLTQQYYMNEGVRRYSALHKKKAIGNHVVNTYNEPGYCFPPAQW